MRKSLHEEETCNITSHVSHALLSVLLHNIYQDNMRSWEEDTQRHVRDLLRLHCLSWILKKSRNTDIKKSVAGKSVSNNYTVLGMRSCIQWRESCQRLPKWERKCQRDVYYPSCLSRDHISMMEKMHHLLLLCDHQCLRVCMSCRQGSPLARSLQIEDSLPAERKGDDVDDDVRKLHSILSRQEESLNKEQECEQEEEG